MLTPALSTVALVALILAASPTLLRAQDSADANAYWYVMTWRLDSFDKLDSLRTQVDRYQSRIIEANRQQNRAVQDEKVLFHHTGDAGAFNVIIMQKYASWDAIDEEGLASDEILETVIADETERQQFRDTQDWMFQGGQHSDHIMIERLGAIP